MGTLAVLLDCHGPVTRGRWELPLPQDDWEDSNPAGTAGELADTTTLFMHTPVLLECDVDNQLTASYGQSEQHHRMWMFVV